MFVKQYFTRGTAGFKVSIFLCFFSVICVQAHCFKYFFKKLNALSCIVYGAYFYPELN